MLSVTIIKVPNKSKLRVSTLILLDGTTTEASSSECSAGGSSGYEDEAISLVSSDSNQSGPISNCTKIVMSGS